jgi:hypothetical protein
MGDRFAECRRCGGKGEVLERDKVLLRDILMECTQYDGSGFSGDSSDYQREQEQVDWQNRIADYNRQTNWK